MSIFPNFRGAFDQNAGPDQRDEILNQIFALPGVFSVAVQKGAPDHIRGTFSAEPEVITALQQIEGITFDFRAMY